MNNKEEKKDKLIKLPLLSLRGMIAFPNASLHFDVQREKSKNALENAMKAGQEVFLVSQKDIRVEEPKQDDLYTVGVVAKVRQTFKIAPNITRVLVEGGYRARLVNCVIGKKQDYAEIEKMPIKALKTVNDKNKAEAYTRIIKNLFEEYSFLSPALPKDIILNILAIDDPNYLCEYICTNLNFAHDDKQSILEESKILSRLEILIQIFENENQILSIEKDIEDKTRTAIDQNQRDYYLREQMRVINQELGDDGGDSELREYFAKLEKLKVDDETREKLFSDIDKLSKMPSHSQEAAVIRQYLDTCFELPFGIFTKDKINLAATQKKLDKDHYGLSQVKDRIIELLAVRKISVDIKGQIICLVGPPGVGKTSIAKSIAESMGRNYSRISLGGVRDESEIRGHRKTYVGAMPGRIINAIKQAKSLNPLILLDEIDKMSSDFRGDPGSALLEVLDPEQNKAFVDHYIEVPVDLSSVLFITTANSLSSIQPALLDRMEIIELSSYTRDEKFNIAKRFLFPKKMREFSLDREQVKISDAVFYMLIDNYTREAGVRKLEREIATLLRKAVRQIVEGDKKSISINIKNIKEYLGAFRFYPEKIFTKNEIGVVNGLAWTSVGGEMLKIEAATMAGTGKVVMTGSLGNVMKESISIAISYIRSRVNQYGVDPDFYKKLDIHVHAPEGAVPKDGPSAGVTMITSMISALSERAVYKNVAMTGEVTLRGNILPIGGLKEKAMAAHRAGVKIVLFPKDNEHDLEKVDSVIRESIRFIPVEHIDDVLNIALAAKPKTLKTKPIIPQEQVNDGALSITQ